MTTPDVVSTPANDKVTNRGIGRNNFDFCRFWLSVLVIFSHSYALAEGDERHEPLGILASDQIGSGRLAVCCFFAISGFLITHSWLRSSSTTNYLMKRVLRIYPGFIVAVLIGFFVVAPLASDHFEIPKRDLAMLPFKSALLIRTEPAGAFPRNPCPDAINGSLWTIPYEFKCYLGLMVLGLLGMLTTGRRLTLVLLLTFVVGNLVYPFVKIPALDRGAFAAIIGSASQWVELLAYFLAGTTFYLYRDAIQFSPGLTVATVMAVGAAAILPPIGKLVFPLGITYLLFWFSFHAPFHFDHWARYGDFSYGIYLYAYPIQQLLVQRIPGISPMTLFMLATPLSVIAGALSWHLIEKRFLKFKKQPVPHSIVISPPSS